METAGYAVMPLLWGAAVVAGAVPLALAWAKRAPPAPDADFI